MRNGQLKPAYNVQIAVESKYVTGIGIFDDSNDIATLTNYILKFKMKEPKIIFMILN